MDIKSRIVELRRYASEEGINVSVKSEVDLLGFLHDHFFTRRPSITLMDNGNFRALWISGDGSQIGLQFLGDRQIQYVLFSSHPGQSFVGRICGRGNFADVDRLIGFGNLWRLT